MRSTGPGTALGLTVLVIAGVYLAAWAALPYEVFWSPDEGGKYLQLIGLRFQGGLHLVPTYGGQVHDPQLRFYPRDRVLPQPVGQGRAVSTWGPWFVLVTWPFYRLAGLAGATLVPVLAGVSTVLLVALLVLRADRSSPGDVAPTAAVACVLVALASPLLPLSVLFQEHSAAACLGTLAILLLLPRGATEERAPRTRGLRLLMGLGPAVSVVAAVAMRREMAIPGIALLGTVLSEGRLWNRRRILLLSLPVILFGVLATWWGFPLVTPVTRGHLRGALPTALSPEVWSAFPKHLVGTLLNTRGWGAARPAPGWTELGFLGVLLCMAARWAPRGVRSEIWACGALWTAVTSCSVLLDRETYYWVHGIFLPYPLMLAAFLPWANPSPTVRPAPGRPIRFLTRFCWIYLIGYVLATFILRRPHGAAEWGPRFGLALYPVLGALATFRLASYGPRRRGEPIRRVLVLGVATVLLAVGLGFSLRSLSTIRSMKQGWQSVARTIEEADQPVVTDTWLVLAQLAPLFAQREMYWIGPETGSRAWLDAMPGSMDRFLCIALPPFTRRIERELPLRIDGERTRRALLTVTPYRVERSPERAR